MIFLNLVVDFIVDKMEELEGGKVWVLCNNDLNGSETTGIPPSLRRMEGIENDFSFLFDRDN